MTRRDCPACGGPDTRGLLDIPQVPALCNLLCETREQALEVRRGDLRLACCENCGHLFNAAFDPALVEYTARYYNSLEASPRFGRYVAGLAADLVARYGLAGKRVIEIGCGQGEFLKRLCRLAGAQGVGFDPSAEAGAGDERVQFVARTFTAADAALEADLIVSRQTLEHLPEPAAFLALLRRTLGNRTTAVVCEVPNLGFVVRQAAVWDLLYEHCSYFSPLSLGRLFARCGFRVERVAEVYDGQYLVLHARPEGPESGEAAGASRAEVGRLAGRYRAKVQGWRETLRQLARRGRRAVVWGAGSKGVMFLNTFREEPALEYVLDVNPRKQGKHIAGAGHKIVPPELLRSYQADLVVMMNPIYREEIRRRLEELSVAANLRGA
jgi:SAM-dependent methyltransferase